MSKTYNARMGQIKHLLFADLGELQSQNKGKLTILEVGAGGGANFEFYPRGTKVVAVDPNERYKKYLVNSVKQFRHVRLDQFIAAEGEDMSAIADNSFDVVVSTLVMCSVKEPKAYVDEIKRVLKPGGKFYYMEHVCATKNSWTHLMQRMLNPVFKFCTDGCQLTKQTWKYIDEAGFSKLEYSLMFAPLRRTTQVIRPHMIGHAIK
ncbi:thiol S-methyltransferase TMT1A-like [Glandiceps talaboti]